MKKSRNQQLNLSLCVCIVSILVALCFIFLGETTAAAQTTIKYANWQLLEPGRGEILDEIIQAFEKKTGVRVERVSVPYSAYNDTLTTQFEAGYGPDVLAVPVATLLPWMKKGYFADLDSIMNLEKYAADFPVQQSWGIMNDKTYAILYEGFPYAGMIYNKELLEKAGVEVPTTPEELISASDAVFKATGKYGIIHWSDLSNLSYLYHGAIMIIYGFGGNVVNDAGEFTVNSPEFIKGVEYFRRIYNLESTPSGMPYGVQREMFLRGNVAICMDGSYWPPTVKMNNPELYAKIGVAKLPFPNEAYVFETNWYAISADSKNKETASEFLEFMLQPEIANKWAVASAIPGLKFTYEAVIKEYPWFQVYAEAAPYGIVEMLPKREHETPEIRKMVAESIAYAISGQISPKDAMEKLQKDLESRFGKEPAM